MLKYRRLNANSSEKSLFQQGSNVSAAFRRWTKDDDLCWVLLLIGILRADIVSWNSDAPPAQRMRSMVEEKISSGWLVDEGSVGFLSFEFLMWVRTFQPAKSEDLA